MKRTNPIETIYKLGLEKKLIAFHIINKKVKGGNKTFDTANTYEEMLKYLNKPDDYRVRLHYRHLSYSRDFTPEEKIRGEFYIKLCLEYNYLPEHLTIENGHPVKHNQTSDDIEIRTNNKRLYAIVECKREGITDKEFKSAIEQGFNYANGLGADYLIIYTGDRIRTFKVSGNKPTERTTNQINRIPNRFGKEPKANFIKGNFENCRIWHNPELELNQIAEECHEIIGKDGKKFSMEVCNQLFKLIFCKYNEEIKNYPTKNGQPNKYQVYLNETSEETANRVRDLYKLFVKDYPDLITIPLTLDDDDITEIVRKTQDIVFHQLDRDVLGHFYQKIVKSFFRGEEGAYYTHENIISYMLNLIKPQSHEKILDLACGSGAFLINALQYQSRIIKQNEPDLEIQTQQLLEYGEKLHGIEINENISEACRMNMLLHKIPLKNIVNTNSLHEFNIFKSRTDLDKNSIDIILTNIPYINKDLEFFQRCYELLKTGGTLGIIIGSSSIESSKHNKLRKYLYDNFEILNITKLPKKAFSYTGTRTLTTILVLKKLDASQTSKNYSTFIAMPDRIGYTSQNLPDQINTLSSELIPKYVEFLKGEKITSNDEKCKITTISNVDIKDKDFNLSPALYFENILELPNKEEIVDQISQNSINFSEVKSEISKILSKGEILLNEKILEELE